MIVPNVKLCTRDGATSQKPSRQPSWRKILYVGTLTLTSCGLVSIMSSLGPDQPLESVHRRLAAKEDQFDCDEKTSDPAHQGMNIETDQSRNARAAAEARAAAVRLAAENEESCPGLKQNIGDALKDELLEVAEKQHPSGKDSEYGDWKNARYELSELNSQIKEKIRTYRTMIANSDGYRKENPEAVKEMFGAGSKAWRMFVYRWKKNECAKRGSRLFHNESKRAELARVDAKYGARMDIIRREMVEECKAIKARRDARKARGVKEPKHKDDKGSRFGQVLSKLAFWKSGRSLA